MGVGVRLGQRRIVLGDGVLPSDDVIFGMAPLRPLRSQPILHGLLMLSVRLVDHLFMNVVRAGYIQISLG